MEVTIEGEPGRVSRMVVKFDGRNSIDAALDVYNEEELRRWTPASRRDVDMGERGWGLTFSREGLKACYYIDDANKGVDVDLFFPPTIRDQVRRDILELMYGNNGAAALSDESE